MAEIFDDGWSDERVKLTANINKVYLTTSEEPAEARIIVPQPIGYLRHEPTGYSLAVYKPISRFHALMLRWCFGVKYEKISNDKA